MIVNVVLIQVNLPIHISEEQLTNFTARVVWKLPFLGCIFWRIQSVSLWNCNWFQVSKDQKVCDAFNFLPKIAKFLFEKRNFLFCISLMHVSIQEICILSNIQ